MSEATPTTPIYRIDDNPIVTDGKALDRWIRVLLADPPKAQVNGTLWEDQMLGFPQMSGFCCVGLGLHDACKDTVQWTGPDEPDALGARIPYVIDEGEHKEIGSDAELDPNYAHLLGVRHEVLGAAYHANDHSRWSFDRIAYWLSEGAPLTTVGAITGSTPIYRAYWGREMDYPYLESSWRTPYRINSPLHGKGLPE